MGRPVGSQGEGEPHAPLHPVAGVDRPLRCHLEGCSPAQEPTLAGVGALGVLTHDNEVAIGGERPGDPHEGPQVDVEVELEAQTEEQAPLEGPGRDRRGADGRAHRPEENGIGPPQFVEDRVGQDLAGTDKTVGAEVVVGRRPG